MTMTAKQCFITALNRNAPEPLCAHAPPTHNT